MASGFNNSFEKAFGTGMAVGSNAALETMKEKIKQDATKAEESLKTSANLAMIAEMSKGADPDTQERLAKILEMKHTPDSSKAILDFATTQVKDKQNFEQTMTQERFKSGMLGVTETIKAMAERGGTFADGTPITAASLQDFGKQASDRLLMNIGAVQPGQPVASGLEGRISESSNQPGQIKSEQSTQQSNASSLMNAPIRSKASFKAEEKEASDTATAENVSEPTYRLMQQFERSYNELKKFDPNFDKEGTEGLITRGFANIANHLDELPETKAFKLGLDPLAHKMAIELEGGRVTNDDVKIQAKKFANALNYPTTTNVRIMAQGYLDLIDKGGNENGKITNQLKEFSKSNLDVFKRTIAQILIEHPEMAKDIYGEGFEVVE